MEAGGVLDPLITILHDLNTTDDLIEKVEACLAVYSPLLMCNKLKDGLCLKVTIFMFFAEKCRQ